jgi:amidohydrolase
MSYFQECESMFLEMQAIRRDLHSHPELGFEEFRTAEIISRSLNQAGLVVTSAIGQTGVVGTLKGGKPGLTILLRFDMDALPIHEETGASYASQNPGVMHACGHDGHVTAGLCIARLLSARYRELAGTFKFMFQPAEEGLGGAELMIRDGVLENPHPDAALAMHLWNERPVGWFGIPSGPLMAGSAIFTVSVVGKGGHGALPHLTIDPILAVSQMILALQSIVSRNVSPLDGAVISVTKIHAGEAFNVIPPSAEFAGTIRTFRKEVQAEVLRRFSEVINAVSCAMGTEVRIDIRELTPAVVNDPKIALAAQQTAREIFPEFHLDTSYQTMVSEDMAFILEKIPGCYIMIGSSNPSAGLDYGHHHPRFDFDERAMIGGAALLAETAVRLASGG